MIIIEAFREDEPMTPEQKSNPFAAQAEANRAEAALLERIETQMRRETILFRVILIGLAVLSAVVIIWRNAAGGLGSIPMDVILIGMVWAIIAIQWRNDARN